MKTINVEDLPFATDEECEQRRRVFIAAGIIRPAKKSDLVSKKGSQVLVATRRVSQAKRHELIKAGIIDPEPCVLIPDDSKSVLHDEGEYTSSVISSDGEYVRRKQAYFRIMQEILQSRKALRLILGKKKPDDPDWYF